MAGTLRATQRMQESSETVSVARSRPAKGLHKELDVLLRHRLLRKPGGFEGLGPVFSEVDPPDGLAIAERPQVPDKSLNRSAA